MKRIYLLSSVFLGLTASFAGVGCQDSFKDCNNARTCPPPGDGDGDASTGGGVGDGDGDTGGGVGDGDGDTGGNGTGGAGDGDGDSTGGMGGDPNDPCLQCADDEYCDVNDECVECLNSSHCGSEMPVCDAGVCVECTGVTDCNVPTLPMCESNSCVAGCTVNEDCTRFGTLGVCDVGSGECVGCLSADDCGGNVCERATNTCLNRPAGALGVCQECEYDDDCQVGQLCVEQQFPATGGGVVGNFCTWRKDGRPETVSASCFSAGKPYAGQPAEPVTSVEGQIAEVCILATTTCPAFIDHRQAVVGCDDATLVSSQACGAAGLDDGLCRQNTGGDFLCTYPCLSDEDCRVGSTCTGESFCSL